MWVLQIDRYRNGEGHALYATIFPAGTNLT